MQLVTEMHRHRTAASEFHRCGYIGIQSCKLGKGTFIAPLGFEPFWFHSTLDRPVHLEHHTIGLIPPSQELDLMSSVLSTMGTVVSEFQSTVSPALCAYTEVHGTVFRIGSVFAILIVINYILALLRYHRAHTFNWHAKRQLPPEYPFLIPYLGPLFQLWWDHGGFVRRVS